MRDATITDTGCYLDNHRGHYITRDAIELAVEFGFIIGPFERFVIDMYDDHCFDDNYPTETLIELCDDATAWLNSGQGTCSYCAGTGGQPLPPYDGEYWTVKDGDGERKCKFCTGTGRGPRIDGQNFPPKVPEGYVWEFNDGDFGLYQIEDND